MENIINKIGEIGISVKKFFNEPQYIEGVYYKDEIYIVKKKFNNNNKNNIFFNNNKRIY